MKRVADRVKGITVEIGGDTTGLSKALSGINKDINTTQSSLKDVERLLKMDPGNTELLRQKYDLLNRSIESTDQKLETLKEAERQVQQQFERGEVSEDQYNALRREIIATEASLRELRTEAANTENTINQIDEGSIDDVRDAAEDAGDELEEAERNASAFGDVLKAEAFVEGAKSIISSLKDVAEETKEYQKIMGSLEISSAKAGYSAEETTAVYEKLYGVLGDDQTAATTTANLQALGYEQDKLNRLVDGTIGAWATYGDSIPIDGLAEAINETVKTGAVTGTFADVLNWAGKSEDDFNLSLEQCSTDLQRANLIFLELANQGLMEAGQQWRTQNEELVKNNEAHAELQAQLAELGKMILPILTEITKGTVALLKGFNSLDSGTKSMILTMISLVAAIGPVIAGVKGISAAMTFLAANPIVLLVGAIVALVALIVTNGQEIQNILQMLDDFLQSVFVRDWTEVFGPVLGTILNGFLGTVKIIWDALKNILSGIVDFIQGVFTGNWSQAWGGIVKIFKGLFGLVGDTVKSVMNTVISWVNKGINLVNKLIRLLNKIPGVDINEIGNISEIGSKASSGKKTGNKKSGMAFMADGGTLFSGSAIVGEEGPELLTMAGGKAVVQPLTSKSTNHTEVGGVTLNVYGAPGQDVRELARIVESEIASEIGRREASLGW